ncbi:MAG: NADPH-dependent curcumin reductase CurA [Cryomorphaceae bacterium]|jgi:NADPH-dependent curcumin reductase CurA
MSSMNRQFLLNARPVGEVKETDLLYAETAMPVVGENQALFQVEYIAVEPAMRGWMEDRASYVAPLKIGDLMRASGVASVIESNNADYPVGMRVSGMFGMQEFAVTDGESYQLTTVEPDIDSPTHLGVLGLTGMTAYCGMKAIGKPTEGDTVFVSGAAGATGSTASQLAKLAGCRVIGTAGSAQKCEWLVDELGLDGAINYKTEDVAARVRELCPKGINVFWDNVGGEILDVALNNLAKQARIVLCGGISRYNATGPLSGPANYFNLIYRNASMTGFVLSDYSYLFPEAVQTLSGYLRDGSMQHAEDILVGFEKTPEAIIRLFRGANTGKQMVKV